MTCVAADQFAAVMGAGRGHHGPVRVVGELAIDITDPELVADHYAHLDGAASRATLAEKVAALAVYPHELTETDVHVKHASETTAVLSVEFVVANPGAADRAAVKVRKEVWGDDWTPEDTAEAVFELVVASSPRPSPGELGLAYSCDADALHVVRD